MRAGAAPSHSRRFNGYLSPFASPQRVDELRSDQCFESYGMQPAVRSGNRTHIKRDHQKRSSPPLPQNGRNGFEARYLLPKAEIERLHDLARSPSRRRMAGVCAKPTAGLDVKRTVGIENDGRRTMGPSFIDPNRELH
jgi:hypothetical protein